MREQQGARVESRKVTQGEDAAERKKQAAGKESWRERHRDQTAEQEEEARRE